jgi:hypothetical protein
MLKYVLPIAMLVGATAPAFAAEYFIVRGADKKCQIVETRPTDTKIVIMGNKAYVSRDEATKEMAIVCK